MQQEQQRVVMLFLYGRGDLEPYLSGEKDWPDGLVILRISPGYLFLFDFDRLCFPHSLRHLSITYKFVEFEGIAHLTFPPSLTHLDLSGSDIGDFGVAGLIFPHSLIHLDLSSTKVGDIGAARLRLPPSLTNLDLSGTRITAEGAARLRLPPRLTVKANPEVEEVIKARLLEAEQAALVWARLSDRTMGEIGRHIQSFILG